MIIVVTNDEGHDVEFTSATRFSTDEANNLCVYEGPNADQVPAWLDDLAQLADPDACTDLGLRHWHARHGDLIVVRVTGG